MSLEKSSGNQPSLATSNRSILVILEVQEESSGDWFHMRWRGSNLPGGIFDNGVHLVIDFFLPFLRVSGL